MSDNQALYREETIIGGVKRLLSGRVNELLGKVEDPIPPLEFGNYRGGSAVVPVIALSTGERSEKERIIRVEAYSLTITLSVPEGSDSERNCYAYAGAVGEDPTLGGVVDRAVLTGKKYVPPKHSGTGGDWELWNWIWRGGGYFGRLLLLRMGVLPPGKRSRFLFGMREVGKEMASLPFPYLVVFASQKLQLKHTNTVIHDGRGNGILAISLSRSFCFAKTPVKIF